VLLLRDTTERPEAVAAGLVRVVGREPETVVRAAARILEGRATLAAVAGDHAFSTAGASARIAQVLADGRYGRVHPCPAPVAPSACAVVPAEAPPAPHHAAVAA
jgi:UDP-N-acetylglucosamine 2-epimerase